MKKKLGLALLTLALLATPAVYVACPQSHAADNSTPWPELYIGYSYKFAQQSPEARYIDICTNGVVMGYKGAFVSVDHDGDGESDTFVNMNLVLMYSFY